MSPLNSRLKIAKSFGNASASYDISARLQRNSGSHLMSWLPNNNDLTVLDLGSGTGFFTDLLASKYKQVIGVDISKKMLNFANQNRHHAILWLQADAYKIPLQNNSIDLVYSNLMVQWCDPLAPIIDEVMRVLKPGGSFVFSTLIDSTLFELKSSWAAVDNDQHVIDFKSDYSVLSLLDGNNRKLKNTQTQDIVLEYENVLHLARELKALGANQVTKKQSKGLAGKESWHKMIKNYQQYQQENGMYPATYKVLSAEVVKL